MNISTCLRRSKKIVYTIWLYSMSRSMFCTKAKIFYAFSQRIVSTVEIGNFVFLLQLVRLFIKMYQFRAHTQTHPAIYYCLWRCIAFNANDKHAYCSARIKLSEKKKKRKRQHIFTAKHKYKLCLHFVFQLKIVLKQSIFQCICVIRKSVDTFFFACSQQTWKIRFWHVPFNKSSQTFTHCKSKQEQLVLPNSRGFNF